MRDSGQPKSDRLFDEVWLNGRLKENLDAVYDGRGDLRWMPPGPGCAPLTPSKLELARARGRTSRASGAGGGTTAPGRLLLRIVPGAIETLSERLSDGITLVSGTSGKTTTARMLAAILMANGQAVVHNRAGANRHWGVCSALAEQAGTVGVFEVDEAWLPLLVAVMRPRLLVLGNLSRDRLGAHGELERLVSLWRRLLRGPNAPPAVVVNADDPLLAGPGGVLDEVVAPSLLYGVQDDRVGHATPDHPHDALACAICGQPLHYTRAFVGHSGHYGCRRCQRSRPEPTVCARGVAERGLAGISATISCSEGSFPLSLEQPGVHNVHNALAATAAALSLGVPLAAIETGLASVQTPFGRSETILVKGRTVHLCLIKNPAGANATFRLLGSDRRVQPLHLWLALRDAVSDGGDFSWIWDVDFEQLAGVVGAVTCAGERAGDLALRLRYAGWRCVPTVEEDLARSFERAVREAPGTLVALPTYTALLGLRGVLNHHGVGVSDWGTTARAC
jgi:UDP-N-acetylmuramyl tripeptide synthase